MNAQICNIPLPSACINPPNPVTIPGLGLALLAGVTYYIEAYFRLAFGAQDNQINLGLNFETVWGITDPLAPAVTCPGNLGSNYGSTGWGGTTQGQGGDLTQISLIQLVPAGPNDVGRSFWVGHIVVGTSGIYAVAAALVITNGNTFVPTIERYSLEATPV